MVNLVSRYNLNKRISKTNPIFFAALILRIQQGQQQLGIARYQAWDSLQPRNSHNTYTQIYVHTNTSHTIFIISTPLYIQDGVSMASKDV